MATLKYFDNLPKILYTKNGVSILYTNLIARASVRPSILKNPLIYYEYDIQDFISQKNCGTMITFFYNRNDNGEQAKKDAMLFKLKWG